MLGSCEHGNKPPAPCMMDNFLSSFLRKAVFHGVSCLVQKLILFWDCITNILPHYEIREKGGLQLFSCY